jgi:hypothetical protein
VSGIAASDHGALDVCRFHLSVDRRALPGLAAGAHMTQRSRRRDGQAQEDRGADATDDIEAGGERRSGRIEQVGAQQLPGPLRASPPAQTYAARGPGAPRRGPA